MLGEDDHQNAWALVKKADALWSLHGMKLSFFSALASLVDVDKPFQVAVVSSRGLGRSGGHNCGGHGGQASSSPDGGQHPGGQQVTSQSKAVASLLPREMACIQSGLCLYHFNFGKKAHSCTPLATRETSMPYPPAGWYTSWTSFLIGISWWTLELPFLFFLILQPAILEPSLGGWGWSAYTMLGAKEVPVVL